MEPVRNEFAGSKPHASGNQGWCQDPSNLAPLLWWLLTCSPEVKKTMEPFKESDETGEGLSDFLEHPLPTNNLHLEGCIKTVVMLC